VDRRSEPFVGRLPTSGLEADEHDAVRQGRIAGSGLLDTS